MTDARAIVEDLARRRVVEEMVSNIARRPPTTPDLKDLVQLVYVILLEYDPAKIEDLDAHGELKYFIARIVVNQYRSTTSTFYYTNKKFLAYAQDIEGKDWPQDR